jgi:hypothetical protein
MSPAGVSSDDGTHRQGGRHMQQVLDAPAPSLRGDAPWGILAAIDLHGCDRDRLADPDRGGTATVTVLRR